MIWSNSLKNKFIIFSLTLVLIIFSGCGIYSFTGASIPPHLKKIFIPVFQDRTASGILTLKEDLSNQLSQKILTQSSLELGTGQVADSRLDGTITSYSNQPYVVSQGVTATTNRISLTVNIIYRDLVKRETIWETNFTQFSEYTIGNISSEQAAVEDVISKLTEDIFSKVVSNW